MATEVSAQPAAALAADTASQTPSFVRPYRHAWIHVFLDRLENLPVPIWGAYGAIAIVTIVAGHLQPWMRGTSQVGSLDTSNLYYGLLTVALLWIASDLPRAAGEAFDEFRPALTLSEPEVARLRYELTVLPAMPALLVTALGLGLPVVSYTIDPASAGVVGLPAVAFGSRLALEAFNSVVLFLLIYQVLRQTRQVRRTIARSAVVDVFQPGPLHAFSKLTSRTAVITIALVLSSLIVVPVPTDPETFVVAWAPYLVLPPMIAAIAFLVPLYGLHNRLVAEKERLQGEADQRLKALLAEINRDVDARALDRADGLNKTLANVLQQRDVLARLTTWPWSTGTIRAFVTAIFLPLFLFVIQLLISRAM